jgi:hypothetical protein
MKTIAHTVDKNVSITYILEDISIRDYCSKFLNNDSNYVELTDNNYPDIYFKDAWELKNSTLSVNINKSKNIQINKWRAARKPLLAALDIEFMRAVESGDIALQSEIAGKKQALRNITLTELPDTLEGIKNTWPEILGQNPFS